jgi:hypothetical protein
MERAACPVCGGMVIAMVCPEGGGDGGDGRWWIRICIANRDERLLRYCQQAPGMMGHAQGGTAPAGALRAGR